MTTLSRAGWARCRQSLPLVSLSLTLGLLVAALAFVPRPGHSAAAPDKVGAPQANAPQYNRDIRPILAENCFACHGPDKAARKGDLRLDIRDEAIKGGAIKPGKPAESSLIERILTDNKNQLMPPLKSHKKLTPLQKKTLERWVAAGAEYQAHWSFLAPTMPALPQVKDKAWVRNPIDAFVLAELERHGLKPAPEADRWTLARRVSLDLTGLPPTPEEVQAFVDDPRPDAYERYVEQKLNSPYWGEHRGRYWLDAARYGDTHGIHFDNYREMWAYRDWVINAFNQNQPFDQFTIEQLAGDLLPERTTEQQVASGFNRCNITTNEGGVIAEEYLVLYTRDRTETASQVWMGLTTGCAVCHDHKLDPISQREFYQMAAFFNNTTQGAMDGNIKDTPPILTVPRTEDRPRYVTLVNMMGEARRQVDERKAQARGEFAKWLKTATVEKMRERLPRQNLQAHAALSDGTDKVKVTVNGKDTELTTGKGLAWEKGIVADKAYRTKAGEALTIPDAGDFDTTNNQGFSFGAWVKLPNARMTGAIVARMDDGKDFRGWDLWVENGQFGTHIVSTWPTDAIKVLSTQSRVKANQWYHVFVTYDGTHKASGVKIYVDGELQSARQVQSDTLKNSIKTTVPLKVGQRNKTSPLVGVGVQNLRLYSRELPLAEVRQIVQGTKGAYLLGKGGKRTPAEVNSLFDWWLSAEDAEYRKLQDAYDRLAAEEGAIKARGTVAHVSQEKAAKPMAYILYRGDYDKRRDAVEPGTPKVLPAMPEKLPRNRLGFAQWLVSGEHPLTARVTVNRFWQEVFGTGIVRTSGDFGIAGELPSHPELLDWLALDFQRNGWDVKRFYRQLLTSATYRQSQVTTAEKREKDPQNTLLSRGPRFRMDAEVIRDQALALGGLLVPRFGGPSVKPYQPDGVWEAVAMIGSNTRDYRRDMGESLYRRSMYTFWKRAAPPASMEIFNAPNREFCVVKRERTNTPLQALVTLNDVQFVESARNLAEKALKQGGTKTDERLDWLAKRVLSRPFRAEEHKVARAMVDDLVEHYRKEPNEAKKLLVFGESPVDTTLDPSTLAGWTMLVNSLLNLDEVLNK